LCTLKQSFRKFYKEQKLVNDLELEMSKTCSKRAHKSYFNVVFELRKYSKSEVTYSFHVPQFRVV
jgi:hypothetical protein